MPEVETRIYGIEKDLKSILKSIEKIEKIVEDYPVIKSKVEGHERIIWLIGSTIIISILGAVLALIYVV